MQINKQFLHIFIYITCTQVPIVDQTPEEDLETEASEQLGSFVDASGLLIRPQEDLVASGSDYTNSVDNNILINSGYSKTDRS